MDNARTSAVPLIGGDRQQLTPSRHQQVRDGAPCRSSRHPSGRDIPNSAISPAFNSDSTHVTGIKEPDVSLGLATIPVQLFTVTSSQGVAFHLLHARCGSRIQMRLELPTPRHRAPRRDGEGVRDRQQAFSSALVIDSFDLEGVIDPVYFEDSYYLTSLSGGRHRRGARGSVALAGMRHLVARTTGCRDRGCVARLARAGGPGQGRGTAGETVVFTWSPYSEASLYARLTAVMLARRAAAPRHDSTEAEGNRFASAPTGGAGRRLAPGAGLR